MYDAAKFRFELPPGPQAERRLAAAPALAAAVLLPATGGPGGPHLRADYRGLRLDYWPELRRGSLRGSLQSFAYGHNAGLFLPVAVGLACREVAAAVGLPPELLLVHRLETGLNLPLADAPGEVLRTLAHHKGEAFLAMVPPARARRPLEVVAHHTDYRLKAYDKGTYARLTNPTGPAWLPLPGLLPEFSDQYAPTRPREGLLPMLKTLQNLTFTPGQLPLHLLRLEAVYLRARALRLPGLPAPLTLADLPTPAALATFAQHLRRLWAQAHYRAVLKFSPHLTPNEAALLVAGAVPEFWPATRATAAPATYKRARAKYRALSAAHRQHVGPSPLTVALEAALRPYLVADAAD